MIRIENLRKEFDKGVVALDSINLTFDEGSFIALLGPSGCGKTTTLNCIAGLLEPTSGSIYFDDRDVTNLAPKDRNIGMVFQSYALYPHMKVIDNIAFSLKQKGMPKAERHEKARQMARKLQIEHLLDRMPSELSGGQQQRVSMARAHVQPGCPSEDRDPGRDPPHPAGSGRYLHHRNPRPGGGHGHGRQDCHPG